MFDDLRHKIATKLGLSSAATTVEPTEDEAALKFWEIGRRARRRAKFINPVRDDRHPRYRPRTRTAQHPDGAMIRVKTSVVAERAKRAQRLQKAYAACAEEGGVWITPQVEQASRDRRAARRRQRAGRRATRPRR